MLGKIYSDPIHHRLGIFPKFWWALGSRKSRNPATQKCPKDAGFGKDRGYQLVFFCLREFFTDWIPWDSSPFLKKTIWENIVGTFSKYQSSLELYGCFNWMVNQIIT